jgi:predicted lipoprotein
MKLARRHLLAGFAALFSGCRAAPDRGTVLETLVREVVASGVAEVTVYSQGLERALGQLAAEPSEERLAVARSAWRHCVLAWKRAGSFRSGPFTEGNALLRATYFPVRPESIEQILTGTRLLDEALLAELGARDKGLFALEYVLFAGPKERPLHGPGSERPRRYAQALARDIVDAAERIARSLGTDGQNYAPGFARDPQAAVTLLVNQMVETLETLAETRLGTVIWMNRVKRLQSSDVEGFASGASHELALAELIGAERLYRGGESHGLSPLVKSLAPELHARLARSFDRALQDVSQLELPVERLVELDPARVEAAQKSLKKLEIGVKNELSSALGVTVTFTSGDSD